VLAVHGKKLASSPLPGSEGEVSGRNEALLVGEREGHPVFERPQSRSDACKADDSVQHEVGLRRLEELGQVTADLNVLNPKLVGELVEGLRA
jgi:hypothetical protein